MYLEHYGIKGQKWGIRRFQNEDRSLTEAGKARYSQISDNNKPKKQPKPKPESSTWKSSEAKYLSDEELNRRNNRLQREKQYRELTASRGQKYLKSVGKIANKVLVASLVGAAAGTAGKHYKEIIESGENFIKAAIKDGAGINLANLRP